MMTIEDVDRLEGVVRMRHQRELEAIAEVRRLVSGPRLWKGSVEEVPNGAGGGSGLKIDDCKLTIANRGEAPGVTPSRGKEVGSTGVSPSRVKVKRAAGAESAVADAVRAILALKDVGAEFSSNALACEVAKKTTVSVHTVKTRLTTQLQYFKGRGLLERGSARGLWKVCPRASFEKSRGENGGRTGNPGTWAMREQIAAEIAEQKGKNGEDEG